MCGSVCFFKNMKPLLQLGSNHLVKLIQRGPLTQIMFHMPLNKAGIVQTIPQRNVEVGTIKNKAVVCAIVLMTNVVRDLAGVAITVGKRLSARLANVMDARNPSFVHEVKLIVFPGKTFSNIKSGGGYREEYRIQPTTDGKNPHSPRAWNYT